MDYKTYRESTLERVSLFNRTFKPWKKWQNVKLTDNASNYKYLEIYYNDNDGVYNSMKIYDPNGKTVFLSILRTDSRRLATLPSTRLPS